MVVFEDLLAEKQSDTQKHVSFALNIVDKEIAHPFDLSKIINEQWYSDNKLLVIDHKCQQIIELVQKDVALPHSYSKRVLESHFQEGFNYLDSVHEIRNYVLVLQVELWMDGEVEQAAELAEAYCLHTTQYAVKAQVMGIYDWKLVQADKEG